MNLMYTRAESEKDLEGIIALQKKNLPTNLTAEEIVSQGFVTVIHNRQDLEKMNAIEQHIICKDEEHDKVVAYLLCMTAASKKDIPVLVPMFEIFDEIFYFGKRVSDYNYMVVGQVCVDKNYRGQGVLDYCYQLYRQSFKDKYDFAITEIACSNTRSLNAHKRIGFTEIHHYTSSVPELWSIVAWKW